jgi:EmrB/QacA subfamily drug resistance transporter
MSGAPAIRRGTAEARWVLAATVLGSSMAFLDSTVVNIALPAIGRRFGAGTSGLQWTLTAYLVTLTALLLIGGSLGDRLGRRLVFEFGLVAFTVASMICGAAPTIGVLIGARALQGVGGALLVPGSLAIISASFHPDDRAWAVGAWSGLAGVSTAIAPFLGGWLIDAVTWRAIFLINLPIAVVAVAISRRWVPETSDLDETGALDWLGAVLVSLALGALAYALIESGQKVGPAEIVMGIVGVAGLVAFVLVEARTSNPMLPLDVFRSKQFTGANLTTLAVYAGLGGATFLLVLQLQYVLGYSALEAGAALLPLSVLLLVLSAQAGVLSQRIGPRLPMTVGPLVAAAGLAWFAAVDEHSRYLTGVFPPAVVFGLGLALTVSPLTATVLAAVEDRRVGVASGVNNAVARGAGLLAIAFLPALVHLDTEAAPAVFGHAYRQATLICAGLCALGGAVAWFTIRRISSGPSMTLPDLAGPCAPAVDGSHAVAAVPDGQPGSSPRT